MQRVEMEGANHDVHGLMGSAFKNDWERRVAVVYINMAEQPRRVNVVFRTGMGERMPTSITPYVTSDKTGDELKQYPKLSADSAVEIPAKSVVTLVAEFA